MKFLTPFKEAAEKMPREDAELTEKTVNELRALADKLESREALLLEYSALNDIHPSKAGMKDSGGRRLVIMYRVEIA
jgi:hypothetical protein